MNNLDSRALTTSVSRKNVILAVDGNELYRAIVSASKQSCVRLYSYHELRIVLNAQCRKLISSSYFLTFEFILYDYYWLNM